MSGDGSRMERCLAIVPALNEAARIADVVSAVRGLTAAPHVLVIDDGSTDGTGAVARRAGADVLTLPFNCGIGASVQAGLLYALRKGYSLVVRLDGDGQHDAQDLPALSSVVARGEADFVLASRYLEGNGYQSTFLRRLGARWFSTLLRVVCGLAVTDPTSGYWVANRRAAEVLLREHSSDYPEVDALVSLSRAGCRIREVPVRMRPRETGRSSIHGIRTLYYMVKVTIALLAGRVRARTPSSPDEVEP